MINKETVNEIRIDGAWVYIEPGTFETQEPEWGAWSEPTWFTATLAGNERQIQGRLTDIKAVQHLPVAPPVAEEPVPFQIGDRVEHRLTRRPGTVRGRKLPAGAGGMSPDSRFPNEICVWFDGEHEALAEWLPAAQFRLRRDDVPGN